VKEKKKGKAETRETYRVCRNKIGSKGREEKWANRYVHWENGETQKNKGQGRKEAKEWLSFPFVRWKRLE